MNRVFNAVKAKFDQLFGQITEAEMQRLENTVKSGNQSKIRTKRAQLSRCVKSCKSVETLVLAGIGASCLKAAIEAFAGKITENALAKESFAIMVIVATVSMVAFLIAAGIGDRAEAMLEEFDKLEARFNRTN